MFAYFLQLFETYIPPAHRLLTPISFQYFLKERCRKEEKNKKNTAIRTFTICFHFESCLYFTCFFLSVSHFCASFDVSFPTKRQFFISMISFWRSVHVSRWFERLRIVSLLQSYHFNHYYYSPFVVCRTHSLSGQQVCNMFLVLKEIEKGICLNKNMIDTFWGGEMVWMNLGSILPRNDKKKHICSTFMPFFKCSFSCLFPFCTVIKH